VSLDPTVLLAIHGRLLEADPTASADLFELVYRPLIGHAIRKHKTFGMDEDRARNLAVEVLAELIERPEIFDPQKGSLFGFLCVMIDGDAKNVGRNESNRQKKFSQFAVEVQEVGGNSYLTSPETRADAKRIMTLYHAEIVVDPGDQDILRLMLEDERDYGPYVEALQIHHLPPDKQKAEVKRRKDRIEKRLQRLGNRL
jgi:hypothetical protein